MKATHSLGSMQTDAPLLQRMLRFLQSIPIKGEPLFTTKEIATAIRCNKGSMDAFLLDPRVLKFKAYGLPGHSAYWGHPNVIKKGIRIGKLRKP